MNGAELDRKVDARVLSAIDALQIDYIGSLDLRKLDEWLDCFTNYGSYTCISRENRNRNLPIAIMLDDCRERLEDRVKIIREVWHGTFEDYATRHIVQRLGCAATQDPGIFTVVTNVIVAYTPDGGTSDLLVTGTYEDDVIVDAGGVAKFRAKNAILDTVVTPRYLVYPV